MNAPAPWLEMWLICFALFGAGKVAALGRTGGLSWAGRARFLGLWVGMDAGAFARPRPATIDAPKPAEWSWTVGKIVFGAVLTWVVTRQAMHIHPLLAGWVGMTGLIFCLHFGMFHLLALVWRRFGVPVEPLMNHPYRAVTLAEFWGQRWNRAYHRLTQDLVFARVNRRHGPQVALWAGFIASGLIHELVVTVPARGGYGGPTLYFLLQAAGLALQRTAPLRRRGFNRGPRGWCWTMLFVAPPVFILFPPPFVERVMLPFLKAIVAL